MQYLGGKAKIAKEIVAAIGKDEALPFWDAFAGGLSMSLAFGGAGIASDANAALVCTYRAVRDGWEPPECVSETEYEAAKALPDSDPLKAFVAIGCSFSGKWFGGYARDGNGRNYARQARAALLRDIPKLSAVEFLALDFMRMPVEKTGHVIYLDPPYQGTTAYAKTGAFDSPAFRARAWEWAEQNTVYVSEYTFDERARVVWQREVKSCVSGSRQAVEKLFKLEC